MAGLFCAADSENYLCSREKLEKRTHQQSYHVSTGKMFDKVFFGYSIRTHHLGKHFQQGELGDRDWEKCMQVPEEMQ